MYYVTLKNFVLRLYCSGWCLSAQWHYRQKASNLFWKKQI